MRRHQVEALLKDAEANSGAQDFKITVPAAELSSALTVLRHLQLAGQFASFSHRDVQCEDCPEGQCGCINIYGYTG